MAHAAGGVLSVPGAPEGADPKFAAVAVTVPSDDVETSTMTRSPSFGAELDTVVDPSPKTVAGVLRRADEWQAPGPSRLGRARSPTDEVSVGLLIRRHDDASGGPDERQPPITIRCTHPDPAGRTGYALPP